MKTNTVSIKDMVDMEVALRGAKRPDLANKMLMLKETTLLGAMQYKKGATALEEIKKCLSERTTRDKILTGIEKIINDMEQVM